MKKILLEIGFVVFALFIIGTLVLGSDTSSMKSQITTVNTSNSTKMNTATSGWNY